MNGFSFGFSYSTLHTHHGHGILQETTRETYFSHGFGDSSTKRSMTMSPREVSSRTLMAFYRQLRDATINGARAARENKEGGSPTGQEILKLAGKGRPKQIE